MVASNLHASLHTTNHGLTDWTSAQIYSAPLRVMNRISFAIVMLTVFVCSQSQAQLARLFGSSRALKGSAVTVVSGLGTATSLSKAFSAKEDLTKASQKAATTERELNRIRALSYSNNDAIYGFHLALTSGASSVFWADLLNKPDVFILLSVEGDGTYLVPDVTCEYAGQPLQLNVFRKRIPAGRRVIIYVMDDDTFSDSIWNSILKTRHEYSLRALLAPALGSATCLANLKVDASLTGKLQLLDRRIVVDAQDFIASVEFSVPKENESPWLATSVLLDSEQSPVGRLEFAQVWTPLQETAARERKAHQDAENAANEARARMVFWSTMGIFFVAALIVYLRRDAQNAAPPPAT